MTTLIVRGSFCKRGNPMRATYLRDIPTAHAAQIGSENVLQTF